MPIYMNVEGIPPDVTAEGHEKWIEVSSFQFNIGLRTGGDLIRRVAVVGRTNCGFELAATPELTVGGFRLRALLPMSLYIVETAASCAPDLWSRLAGACAQVADIKDLRQESSEHSTSSGSTERSNCDRGTGPLYHWRGRVHDTRARYTASLAEVRVRRSDGLSEMEAVMRIGSCPTFLQTQQWDPGLLTSEPARVQPRQKKERLLVRSERRARPSPVVERTCYLHGWLRTRANLAGGDRP